MRVVVFPQHLYLSDTIIEHGMPLAGEVINGRWWWVLNNGMEEAHRMEYFTWKNDNTIYDESTRVNQWEHKGFDKIVFVPRTMKNLSDYNYIIEWASTQEDCSNNLDELKDMDEIDRINIEKEILDDDDIPF